MKLFLSQHKRAFWIVFALIFIAILFFIKNPNLFTSTEKYFGVNQQNGLTYDPNMTVADLVNKSTTGDGIPDWEKVLFGLDPTKTENIPGVPDSVTIAKLQAQQTADGGGFASTGSQDGSKLTQTDQFSRDFLATISSLTQSGAIDSNGNMDQATVDKITNSLSDSVQNSPQRKIYTLSDIKIVNDNSINAAKKYNNALNSISTVGQVKYSVMDVFQKFAPDATGNNTNPAVLPELDPIIKQMNDFLNIALQAPVPQALATLHLYMINGLEGMIENLTDVQQYNTDPIVAFSGMSKYEQNSTLFTSASQYIAVLLDMKLNPK
jgi:hypothetical protein